MRKFNNNYKLVNKSITAHIIPKKEFSQQKRYMQRFIRKPFNWKVKDFVERVIAMNELLTLFPNPSSTLAATKIPEDKILDLL